MKKVDKSLVYAWLLLAKKHHDAIVEIEKELQTILGEEKCGHVSDFVWCGQVDAHVLIRKVGVQNKMIRKSGRRTYERNICV